MTGSSLGAVDEHRTDRRGEWISHRYSFESVISDEVLCGVFREFALWARSNNAGSEQCLFYIMPAHRARMRMRAFLRDRCRLHQLGIDVPIDRGKRVNDPVRIILRNDGN